MKGRMSICCLRNCFYHYITVCSCFILGGGAGKGGGEGKGQTGKGIDISWIISLVCTQPNMQDSNCPDSAPIVFSICNAVSIKQISYKVPLASVSLLLFYSAIRSVLPQFCNAIYAGRFLHLWQSPQDSFLQESLTKGQPWGTLWSPMLHFSIHTVVLSPATWYKIPNSQMSVLMA